MKILIFLFLFFFNFSFSQTTLECYTNNDEKILQKYLPNYLNIKSNKKIIDISIDEGKIVKTEKEGLYIVTTGEKNHSTIIVKFKGENKEILFRNKELPLADLSFSGEFINDGDSISSTVFKRPLLQIRPFIFTNSVCNDWNIKIESITIIRIDKYKILSLETINETIKSKLIPLAENGDTYIFTNVKVKLTDVILPGKTILINVIE